MRAVCPFKVRYENPTPSTRSWTTRPTSAARWSSRPSCGRTSGSSPAGRVLFVVGGLPLPGAVGRDAPSVPSRMRGGAHPGASPAIPPRRALSSASAGASKQRENQGTMQRKLEEPPLPPRAGARRAPSSASAPCPSPGARFLDGSGSSATILARGFTPARARVTVSPLARAFDELRKMRLRRGDVDDASHPRGWMARVTNLVRSCRPQWGTAASSRPDAFRSDEPRSCGGRPHLSALARSMRLLCGRLRALLLACGGGTDRLGRRREERAAAAGRAPGGRPHVPTFSGGLPCSTCLSARTARGAARESSATARRAVAGRDRSGSHPPGFGALPGHPDRVSGCGLLLLSHRALPTRHSRRPVGSRRLPLHRLRLAARFAGPLACGAPGRAEKRLGVLLYP